MKVTIEIRNDMVDTFNVNRFRTTFDKVIADCACVDTVTADKDDIAVLRMVRDALISGEVTED